MSDEVDDYWHTHRQPGRPADRHRGDGRQHRGVERYDPDSATAEDLDDDQHAGFACGGKGYLGTGMLTPTHKPPGGELTEGQKNLNSQIKRPGAVAERVIAHLKTWRVLHTDYRRPLATYPTAFQAVRALHFFQLSCE